MKVLFFLILLILSSFGNAQTSESTCFKTKWRSLKPEFNPELFDTTFNIIDSVKKAVYAEKIIIYNEINDADVIIESKYRTGDWVPIPKLEFKLNPKTKDTIYRKPISDYFEMRVEYMLPLLNENGEPKVQKDKNGRKSFVYADPEVYSVTMNMIQEIRIREEKILDSLSNEYYFKPVGISFYIINETYGRELFWMYITDLKSCFVSVENYSWYKILIDKLYQGSNYKLEDCAGKLME